MSASARDVILNAVGDTADEIGAGLVINVTDAILTALSAAGFVVVPREPTEEMWWATMNLAGTDTFGIFKKEWSAMLSAAEGKK